MSESESLVYRNVAAALFEEDPDLPANGYRRTRVSARFDRTRWDAEMHRMPDRGNSPSFGRTTNDFTPRDHDLPKRGRAPVQPLKRYTEAEISAKPEHGVYRLVRIDPHGENGGWRITAVCAGGHCDGRVRIFFTHTWMITQEGVNGCSLCDQRNRSEKRRVEVEGTTNKTHGLYELIGFDHDTSSHRLVLARCNGPRCGGATRKFSHSEWQTDSEGLLGCRKCNRLNWVPRKCPQGHVYDAANTVVDACGSRRCKQCQVARRDKRLVQMRAYWHGHKEERALAERVRPVAPIANEMVAV